MSQCLAGKRTSVVKYFTSKLNKYKHNQHTTPPVDKNIIKLEYLAVYGRASMSECASRK